MTWSARLALASLAIAGGGLGRIRGVGLLALVAYVAALVLVPAIRVRIVDRPRAVNALRLLSAALVLVASVPTVLPLPDRFDAATAEGARLVAHLLLAAVAALAVDVPTRRGPLYGVGAGVLLLGATASVPGTPSLRLLVAAWLVLAIATLATHERESTADLPTLERVEGSVAPARQRLVVQAGVVLLALVLLVPLAATVRPPTFDASQSFRGEGDGGDGQQGADAPPYTELQGSLDTGNRFTLGDEVVFRVRAAAPDFWRGQTFDTWDGRAWRRSQLLVSPVPTFEGEAVLPPLAGDVVGPSEPLTQTVTIVQGGGSLVFGAYRPQAVRSKVGDFQQASDGAIRRAEPFGDGEVYTVLSDRPVVTAAELRAGGDVAGRVDGERFFQRYLQLPEVPDRVTELAERLTADQPTTYDQVRAIEAWLGANTTYTLDIPPLPPGADAVEQYLFVDRRGFCEQIATALAVMLRSVGVPTRVTTGYVPGDRDWLTGEFTVRERDAHAWVEVWFPDVGWQAFDPTADVPLSGEFEQGFADRLRSTAGGLLPLLAALAILASVLAAGVLGWRLVRRRGRAGESWVGPRLHRLERWGRSHGVVRRRSQTPAAYCQELVDVTEVPPSLLADLGDRLTRAAYGPPGDDTTGDAARVEVDAALRTLTRRHRAGLRRARAITRRAGRGRDEAGPAARTDRTRPRADSRTG